MPEKLSARLRRGVDNGRAALTRAETSPDGLMALDIVTEQLEHLIALLDSEAKRFDSAIPDIAGRDQIPYTPPVPPFDRSRF